MLRCVWGLICNHSTALEDDELGLSDMRTEFVDGEYRAPAGMKHRDPEELRAAAEARRQALEAKGAFAGAGVSAVQRRARASHILVADEALCLEIKSKLDAMVEADATAIAAQFSTLATEHSSCPSSGQGGLLGTFAPGKMVADFDAVIFGQPDQSLTTMSETEGTAAATNGGGDVGVVHGPVKTQFGYHLILIHERQ
jgi:peptidyl-prolyl cis-trans isomerase C